MRRTTVGLPTLFLLLTLSLLSCARAEAHPLSQGALTVTLHPDHVSVRARVTVEEVTVTNRLAGPDAAPGPFAAMDSAAYEQHAAYLAMHLHVLADGVALPGGVASVSPPDNPQPGPTDVAVYDLLYPLPAKAPSPRQLELRSDVLTETAAAPGVSWEASYVVRIEQPAHARVGPYLLTSRAPVILTFGAPASGTEGTAALSASPGRKAIFGQYFLHGIHHIFSVRDPGYDHLLFVSALVLGATTLWELFKLVTAFTLAHTITLTLAALNLVHVSERLVEPLIAASICFVAIENVVWPRRSHGWVRLGVAFFFGLFHGLGFAGALLEAMQGMNGPVVLIAILAFSLGVETAHQMVVIPLYLLLKLMRETRQGAQRRQAFALRAQRFGSAAISLAGLFYLVVALRLSLGL